VLPNHFWIGLGDPAARVPAQPARNGVNGVKKKTRRAKVKATEATPEIKELA
jgi:hypothetical protein